MTKSTINLVIIGHKDHGKSTLIGRLIYDSKAIPEQKIQEIKEETQRTGRGQFKFSYLLDSLEEERKGGLTIDIMHTPFKTRKHLYTIIDCPGHKEFIKNMITGASQADAAVLVISAKEGIEDQTKQHTYLVKTLGIKQLVVAVNKMDEINYDQSIFQEILERLNRFLDSLDYKNVPTIPLSALRGDNVFKKSRKMAWYDGTTFIDALDQNITPPALPTDKPLRGFVQDVYDTEKGKIIICKIETGSIETGKDLFFSPSTQKGLIKKIELFGKEVDRAEPGDSVELSVGGVDQIRRGEVISYPQNKAEIIQSFTAQIIVLTDIQIENNDVLKIRYGTAERKCKVQKILEKMDPINLTTQQKLHGGLKDGDIARVKFSTLDPTCLEKYSEIPQLGRFVVEGKKGTAAAGIVLKVNKSL
ncbi:MAG: GTP-binding protein [Candidatus Bathyarchaeota archaeon]|nr:GTP-binding protein [Candidatus Bathyarchaeota archaeon]MDH5780148.1 GTP-binding protein [Candidatus Bathyarchaeota archaeon]